MSLPELPSHLQLPPGPWGTLLEGLCAHFPAISKSTWEARFAHGRVRDAQGQPLAACAAWQVGQEVTYFREVADEAVIPFVEHVVWEDDDLLVADKPHFLPVVPAGRFVQQTLLARLIARTGNPSLVPLHRIDRATAGLVLFSKRRQTRGAYHQLFACRHIEKHYEAIAPALPALHFPHQRHSHLRAGEPFFRMCEVLSAPPNALTQIDVMADLGSHWHYRLQPVTGRKHQLRVHMAALGAPICGDELYPTLAARPPEDYRQPLQLLARALSFEDPLSGQRREFVSQLALAGVDGASG